MNWVGGARSRLQRHSDKRKQQEYFEKKRHEKKTGKVKLTESKPKVFGISQDLLSLRTITNAHGAIKKPKQEGSCKPRYVKIDSQASNRSGGHMTLSTSPILEASNLQFNSALDPVLHQCNQSIHSSQLDPVLHKFNQSIHSSQHCKDKIRTHFKIPVASSTPAVMRKHSTIVNKQLQLHPEVENNALNKEQKIQMDYNGNYESNKNSIQQRNYKKPKIFEDLNSNVLQHSHRINENSHHISNVLQHSHLSNHNSQRIRSHRSNETQHNYKTGNDKVYLNSEANKVKSNILHEIPSNIEKDTHTTRDKDIHKTRDKDTRKTLLTPIYRQHRSKAQMTPLNRHHLKTPYAKLTTTNKASSYLNLYQSFRAKVANNQDKGGGNQGVGYDSSELLKHPYQIDRRNDGNQFESHQRVDSQYKVVNHQGDDAYNGSENIVGKENLPYSCSKNLFQQQILPKTVSNSIIVSPESLIKSINTKEFNHVPKFVNIANSCHFENINGSERINTNIFHILNDTNPFFNSKNKEVLNKDKFSSKQSLVNKVLERNYITPMTTPLISMVTAKHSAANTQQDINVMKQEKKQFKENFKEDKSSILFTNAKHESRSIRPNISMVTYETENTQQKTSNIIIEINNEMKMNKDVKEILEKFGSGNENQSIKHKEIHGTIKCDIASKSYLQCIAQNESPIISTQEFNRNNESQSSCRSHKYDISLNESLSVNNNQVMSISQNETPIAVHDNLLFKTQKQNISQNETPIAVHDKLLCKTQQQNISQNESAYASDDSSKNETPIGTPENQLYKYQESNISPNQTPNRTPKTTTDQVHSQSNSSLTPRTPQTPIRVTSFVTPDKLHTDMFSYSENDTMNHQPDLNSCRSISTHNLQNRNISTHNLQNRKISTLDLQNKNHLNNLSTEENNVPEQLNNTSKCNSPRSCNTSKCNSPETHSTSKYNSPAVSLNITTTQGVEDCSTFPKNAEKKKVVSLLHCEVDKEDSGKDRKDEITRINIKSIADNALEYLSVRDSYLYEDYLMLKTFMMLKADNDQSEVCSQNMYSLSEE